MYAPPVLLPELPGLGTNEGDAAPMGGLPVTVLNETLFDPGAGPLDGGLPLPPWGG